VVERFLELVDIKLDEVVEGSEGSWTRQVLL